MAASVLLDTHSNQDEGYQRDTLTSHDNLHAQQHPSKPHVTLPSSSPPASRTRAKKQSSQPNTTSSTSNLPQPKTKLRPSLSNTLGITVLGRKRHISTEPDQVLPTAEEEDPILDSLIQKSDAVDSSSSAGHKMQFYNKSKSRSPADASAVKQSFSLLDRARAVSPLPRRIRGSAQANTSRIAKPRASIDSDGVTPSLASSIAVALYPKSTKKPLGPPVNTAPVAIPLPRQSSPTSSRSSPTSKGSPTSGSSPPSRLRPPVTDKTHDGSSQKLRKTGKTTPTPAPGVENRTPPLVQSNSRPGSRSSLSPANGGSGSGSRSRLAIPSAVATESKSSRRLPASPLSKDASIASDSSTSRSSLAPTPSSTSGVRNMFGSTRSTRSKGHEHTNSDSTAIAAPSSKKKAKLSGGFGFGRSSTPTAASGSTSSNNATPQAPKTPTSANTHGKKKSISSSTPLARAVLQSAASTPASVASYNTANTESPCALTAAAKQFAAEATTRILDEQKDGVVAMDDSFVVYGKSSMDLIPGFVVDEEEDDEDEDAGNVSALLSVDFGAPTPAKRFKSFLHSPSNPSNATRPDTIQGVLPSDNYRGRNTVNPPPENPNFLSPLGPSTRNRNRPSGHRSMARSRTPSNSSLAGSRKSSHSSRNTRRQPQLRNGDNRGSILAWETVAERSLELLEGDADGLAMIADLELLGAGLGTMSPGFGTPMLPRTSIAGSVVSFSTVPSPNASEDGGFFPSNISGNRDKANEKYAFVFSPEGCDVPGGWPAGSGRNVPESPCPAPPPGTITQLLFPGASSGKGGLPPLPALAISAPEMDEPWSSTSDATITSNASASLLTQLAQAAEQVRALQAAKAALESELARTRGGLQAQVDSLSEGIHTLELQRDNLDTQRSGLAMEKDALITSNESLKVETSAQQRTLAAQTRTIRGYRKLASAKDAYCGWHNVANEVEAGRELVKANRAVLATLMQSLEVLASTC